jgi:mannose-6-phosphate isomerase-like protein (cupin superfamily)
MALAAPSSPEAVSSFITPAHISYLSTVGFTGETVPKQFFNPWNVNLGGFLPGTHSSNSHSHSREDEFSIVLSGQGRYWCQGEEPEKVVKAGDCIGWKAGTGVCHCILNDADGPNGEG